MRPKFGWAIAGAAIALICPGSIQAQTAPEASGNNETAYKALRLVAQTLGRDALDRVVEVTGRDGVPQPFLWKIVLQEGTSGTREIDVAGGKIAAQRTLSRPPSTHAAIHFQELNLDSSGAFDATDAQARKVRLRFDSVNYVLRTSEASGKPQWTLDLFDKEGVVIGAMRLSANDGNVVSIDGKLADGPTPTVVPRPPAVVTTGRSTETTTATPRVTETAPTVSRIKESRTTTVTTTTVEPPPPPPPPPAPPTADTVVVEDTPVDRGEGGLFTRTGRTLDKTTQTVEHHLLRAGATVQRFFTRRGDPEPDATPTPPRDPNYRGD